MEAIKFKYKGKEEKGVLVNQDKDQLTIKLSSGYNIIVNKKEVKILEEKELKKTDKKKSEKQEPNKDLPKITILHTGGTIASKVDYSTGAVVAKFSSEELLELFPELKKIANIDSVLVSNMMSDDMRFNHYNIIAEEVTKAVKKSVKGVIVTHGTDTLHYTASALSFMLKNISIPVVLVGSQRSSDRGSSDSASNLLAATRFIKKSKGSGVFVCMHKTSGDEEWGVIRGTNARKMHSSRRDAFKPVNDHYYATISKKKVDIHESESINVNPKNKLVFHKLNPKLKIGLLYIHPNMFVEEFNNYKDFDGLVLIGTGLGHAPISDFDEATKSHLKNRIVIKELASKMPVAMTTQTINGRINMNVYTPGRVLQEIGVLGNGLNLTPETAFMKLAFLLSTEKKLETIKELYSKNLVGELRTRSEYNEFEE